MTKHLVIPDVQFRPGDDPGFLGHIAQYICDHKPDKVICIGDFADMPSLSTYDVGKKSFEGRRYKADVEAVHTAMDILTRPIWDEVSRVRKAKKRQWNPELYLTLGNHEDRITRAVNDDPKLDGTIGIADLGYEKYGWKVIPYLVPIVLDGIAYSHYFSSGPMGRPIGTANLMVNKLHMSSIAGHQQGRQVAYGRRADGIPITCMILGSCYTHEESYLGPQGNKHFRGIAVLNEVSEGAFDEMFVSLKYLEGKYGQ